MYEVNKFSVWMLLVYFFLEVLSSDRLWKNVVFVVDFILDCSYIWNKVSYFSKNYDWGFCFVFFIFTCISMLLVDVNLKFNIKL